MPARDRPNRDQPDQDLPAPDGSAQDAPAPDGGARAILRVPEVLMEIAGARRGLSLAELDARLSIPKASLHRLLRELGRGGYLVHEAGAYRLGPSSFHLAALVTQAAPARPFPACARPELERLAEATGETVMLGVLSESGAEIIYVDVIDSKAAVRFTIPIGDRRPLHSVASGKAVLAFLPEVARQAYLEGADFTRFTAQTTSKAELPAVLREIGAAGVALDSGGRAAGASALASPVLDAGGLAFGAISVAGPADRIALATPRLGALVLTAGERISRVLGYTGAYPPHSGA
jgi:DNA-binding IclR family transcriptional regulator